MLYLYFFINIKYNTVDATYMIHAYKIQSLIGFKITWNGLGHILIYKKKSVLRLKFRKKWYLINKHFL
jgi:hypothetical protein